MLSSHLEAKGQPALAVQGAMPQSQPAPAPDWRDAFRAYPTLPPPPADEEAERLRDEARVCRYRATEARLEASRQERLARELDRRATLLDRESRMGRRAGKES